MHAKQCTQKEEMDRIPVRKIMTRSTRHSQNQDHSNDKEEANLPSKVNETRNVTQPDVSILEQHHPKMIRRKPVRSTRNLDEFVEKKGIHAEGEEQPAVQLKLAGFSSLPHLYGGENNISEDGNHVDEQELGPFACDGDQVMDIDHAEERMNQGDAIKNKKVLLNKKVQSCRKKKGFDLCIEAQSSAKLVRGRKKEALESHKRKQPMPFTLDGIKGQNRLNSMHTKQGTQKEGMNSLPVRKIVTRSTRCYQNQDHNNDKEEAVMNRLLVRKIVFRSTRRSRNQDHSNDKEEANLPSTVSGSVSQPDASIQQQQDPKQIRMKPVFPAMSLDKFLEKEGINVEGVERPAVQPMVAGVRSMPFPDAGENNFISEDENGVGENNYISEDDDNNVGENNYISEDDNDVGENNCVSGDVDEHELDLFDCDGDQVMEIDHAKGTSKNRRTRGQTTCKDIHARTWEEREEVTFDKGQAVGPTDKRVNDLTKFLGTVARNSKFVSLLYTSWKAVPDKPVKKCLWEYVQSKFIIPEEGKKWVMDGIREAWRRHKRVIKKKHFEKYDNIEDMLKNRPTNIPEVQFQKLIAYWSLPAVQSKCHVNSENCKKQKWRHRMGPTNFGRVRVGLRENGENKEPTQLDVFVATRMGRNGKQLDHLTEAVITELKDCQNACETAEDAFQVVFGKEQPGRIRCFGRSITKSSLKKDEEISKIKQKHFEEVVSLKTDLHETKEEVQDLRNLVQLLLQQNNPGLNVAEVLTSMRAKNFLPGANSAGDSIGQHLRQSSASTHVPSHD